MCHSLCFGSRANKAQPQAGGAHSLTRKARGRLDTAVHEKHGNQGRHLHRVERLGPRGGSDCAEI